MSMKRGVSPCVIARIALATGCLACMPAVAARQASSPSGAHIAAVTDQRQSSLNSGEARVLQRVPLPGARDVLRLGPR